MINAAAAPGAVNANVGSQSTAGGNETDAGLWSRAMDQASAPLASPKSASPQAPAKDSTDISAEAVTPTPETPPSNTASRMRRLTRRPPPPMPRTARILTRRWGTPRRTIGCRKMRRLRQRLRRAPPCRRPCHQRRARHPKHHPMKRQRQETRRFQPSLPAAIPACLLPRLCWRHPPRRTQRQTQRRTMQQRRRWTAR